MARNYFQVMGHGEEPELSDLLICWTEDTTYQYGGTSQAVRIALDHNIPVLNLIEDHQFERAIELIQQL